MVAQSASAKMKPDKIIAICLTIGLPVVILLVSAILSPKPFAPDGVNNMMVFILLIVAIVDPTFYFVIEKTKVSEYRKSTASQMAPDQLYRSLVLVRLALAASCYVMALVVFLITHDILQMLFFYPIGIIWTVILWPRPSGRERFMARLSQT